MKITKLGGDQNRVFFTTKEYGKLLQSSVTAKFKNSQRLAAHSLRRGEIVDLRYDQFKQISTPRGDIWMIQIQGKDTTDRDQSAKEREVWVPDDLVDSIRENAGRHWETSRQFFGNGKSTFNNRMQATRKATAKKTGNDRYLKVTIHDYRRYFANHFIFRHELDPEIVRQLGGWASARSMLEYLKRPDDILAHRLHEKGMLNTPADLNRGVLDQPVEQAIQNIQEEVEGSNKKKKREIVTLLQPLIDDIDGVELSASRLLDAAKSHSNDEDDDGLQASLAKLKSENENSIQSRTIVGSIASVVKYHTVLTGLRAKTEREWMRDDPDLVDPATPYGAASLLGASLVGGVMIAIMLALGHSLPVMILATVIAGAISMVTEQAEVQPSTDHTARSL